MGFYDILLKLLEELRDETFTKKDLVRVTGLNSRSIDRHLQSLEKYGFISIVIYKKNGKENYYKLNNKVDLDEFINNCFK